MHQFCTACQKAMATVFVLDMREGAVVGQHHLCQGCAEQQGVVQAKTNPLKLPQELLEDLLGAAAKAPDPTPDETRYGDRLLALMQVEKVYRQEGLTIARLARTLDLPEYRLRRVINQQLGYRNFNAFLNAFRIEDACRVLADPAQERLPILNLALDLGYGSQGPFNRAFRAKTGHTPTEYRRIRLGTSSPAA